MKVCRKCLKELPISSFKKNKNWVMLDCRSCYYTYVIKPSRSKKRKPRLILTEEERLIRKRESRKRYKINNPDKVVDQRRRHRERNKNNPIFKTQRNIRKRLKKQLDKGFKIGQTSEMLGCSLLDFKSYIESQFTESMNWDNYGSYWHIDHIKPVCSFDLTQPNIARQVNHYTNLRPLKAEDNIKKSLEDSKLKFVTVESKTRK
jgi:hypothetical protein